MSEPSNIVTIDSAPKEKTTKANLSAQNVGESIRKNIIASCATKLQSMRTKKKKKNMCQLKKTRKISKVLNTSCKVKLC